MNIDILCATTACSGPVAFHLILNALFFPQIIWFKWWWVYWFDAF